MLKLSIIELFLRTIPESLIFILSAHAFSKQQINKKKFIISSISLAFLTYLIRMFPITLGIHTLVFMVAYAIVVILINKLPIFKAISSVFISTIVLIISEGINLFILEKILNIDIELEFKSTLLKLIYGIPSLLIFAIIVLFVYKKMHYRKVADDVLD